jgi:hypothetical protein
MNPTQIPPAEVCVTPADTLRAAALYLEHHGWTQHTLYNLEKLITFPPACAIGAITIAAYGRPTDEPGNTADPSFRDYMRAFDALEDHLDAEGLTDPQPDDDPSLPWGAPVWNDTPGRTADEVIAALRAAADAWERPHSGGAR